MIHKKGEVITHLCAGGFIFWKNKVLLVKSHWHGGIIPPHGHKEKGETLLKTAMREICEETGYCHLQPLKYLGFAKYSFSEGKVTHTKTEHRWLFTLTNEQRQKKQTEESELLENKWYTLSGALRAATFENTKKHLLQIQEFVNSRQFKKQLVDQKKRRLA